MKNYVRIKMWIFCNYTQLHLQAFLLVQVLLEDFWFTNANLSEYTECSGAADYENVVKSDDGSTVF